MQRTLTFSFCVIALVVFLLAFLLMLRLQPTYQTSAVMIGKETANGEGGSTSMASGLAARFLGAGASGSNTNFDKFQKFWGSRDVAQRLINKNPDLLQLVFAQNWNKKTSRWRTSPSGAREWLSAGLNWVFGMKLVYRPDADDLARYIKQTIPLQQESEGTSVRATFSNPDPEWAYRFLNLVINETDGAVRDAEHRRSVEFIAFAQARLGAEQNVEYRQALIDFLRRYEMQNMYAQAGENFSFQYIEHPARPAKFAFPRPLQFTIFAFIFANMTAGFFVVMALLWPTGRLRGWADKLYTWGNPRLQRMRSRLLPLGTK